MISFQTLITVAPFEEDVRADILAKEDSLTEDQKAKIVFIAWQSIAQVQHAKLQKDTDMLLLDMQSGKVPFSREAFGKLKDKLAHELAKQLDSAGTQKEIEDVKKELAKHEQSPTSQQSTS